MKILNTLIRTTALITVLIVSAPKTYAMDKQEDDQPPSKRATQLLHTLAPDSDHGTRQIQVQKTLSIDSAVFIPDEIWTQILSQTVDLQIVASEDKEINQCLSRLRGVCRGFYTRVNAAPKRYIALNVCHPPGFFEQFPNLTNLNLTGNTIISDDDLHRLTQLKNLSLALNGKIIHVSHLTNLKNLSLHANCMISDGELVPLTQLENLNLDRNPKIIHLSHLTNLTNLNLRRNVLVLNEELAPLTQLNTLSLHENYKISDNGLAPLIQLKNLNLSMNESIIHVSHLSNLKNLVLFGNSKILDEELIPLTQLETLDLEENDTVTNLSSLTNLRDLKQ